MARNSLEQRQRVDIQQLEEKAELASKHKETEAEAEKEKEKENDEGEGG